MKYVTN